MKNWWAFTKKRGKKKKNPIFPLNRYCCNVLQPPFFYFRSIVYPFIIGVGRVSSQSLTAPPTHSINWLSVSKSRMIRLFSSTATSWKSCYQNSETVKCHSPSWQKLLRCSLGKKFSVLFGRMIVWMYKRRLLAKRKTHTKWKYEPS